MTIYEAWEDPADHSVLLATTDEVAAHRTKNLLNAGARLLYRFEAATWEEANAIHALRMGWDPYRPVGAATSCPRCGATYYAQGSGQCWRCGTSE
jgi:hypothetical protein